MNHIINILYCLYCGANFYLIYKYLSNLISGKKIFKKNINVKNTFENRINSLKENNTFIGLEKQNINYNIPFIYEILNEMNFLEKKFRGLIIGCFEGHSTIFFLMHSKNSVFDCVDNWNQEILKEYSSNAEGYFNQNINVFKDRVKKHKKESNLFFENNKCIYDFIYLDGAHSNVEKDCINSYKYLNKNGLLIINSVFWRKKWSSKDNNLRGILKFLKKIDGYKIIRLTRNTLFLKKIGL